MFEGNTMKLINYAATFLASLGAINWGAVGLLDTNLVHTLVGSLPWLEKAIYGIIGASGLWSGFSLFTRDSCKTH